MKIVTFGCRLNSFESVVIQKQGADLDDVFVVNTCAVTSEAERQCRQEIRKIKRQYPDMKIIVTGCAAQLHPEEYAMMPEVYRVLGNREKLTKEALFHTEKVMVADIMDDDSSFDVPIIADFEGRTRAFLQVQQGCSHACTFCIIHTARGKNKGVPLNQVVEQAKTFVEKGFQELVLTGVDITSYPQGFNLLLKTILTQVPGLKRLRLGSLDPACLDEEFINLYKEYPVLMPHLHLSAQAGDNLILKRMGRRHSFEQVVEICQQLREIRKDIIFGADFITGFPTETEAQFLNTIELVKKAQISKLHVFPYSVREGTPAAKMPMVPVSERKERAARLRQTGTELYKNILQEHIGKTESVLIENEGFGYTENYIKVKTNSNAIGEIIPIKITAEQDDELVGQA